MQNSLATLSTFLKSRGGMCAVLLVLSVAVAAAQTTPAVGDYSAQIETFGTGMNNVITSNLGKLLGILTAFLGLGFVIKFIKRAVKSV